MRTVRYKACVADHWFCVYHEMCIIFLYLSKGKMRNSQHILTWAYISIISKRLLMSIEKDKNSLIGWNVSSAHKSIRVHKWTVRVSENSYLISVFSPFLIACHCLFYCSDCNSTPFWKRGSWENRLPKSFFFATVNWKLRQHLSANGDGENCAISMPEQEKYYD